MSFMKPVIYNAGILLSGECAICGATNWAHQHAQPESYHMIESGNLECDQCASGHVDQETIMNHGIQFAGRYSANGYMDCTDWHYNVDEAALVLELKDAYGDDDMDDENVFHDGGM
jgi:hypothetical protein